MGAIDLQAQCSVEMGPPPPGRIFKTGGDEPGYNDKRWLISTDSIDGEYRPAIIMDSLPSVYYSSSDWISLANPGEHSDDRLFYFKSSFELPCKNLCGVSYNEPNTFCVSLDIYVDNSILEIYVNGIPQSERLDKIPFDDPFHPENHSPNSPIPVTLCNDWKAGANTIIIVAASSAPILGLMIAESAHPPFPPGTDTLSVRICQGETYTFNEQPLNTSGLYWYTYTNAAGCDSLKVLELNVHPVPSTVISTSICKGQQYEGYEKSGSYTDVFSSSTGCDSIRLLHLIVNETPEPDLGEITALCAGDSLVLNPGSFLNYRWQDGSSSNRYIVTQPGVYSVMVSNGCYSATKKIRIADGICDINFANAFSPNGDGKNDRFLLRSDLRLQHFRLSVYNRWGQKVFETSDPLRGWDGGYSGIPQPAGAYVWYCHFSRNGSVAKRKGTVMLYR